MNVDLTEFVWIWNKTQNLTTPKHHRRICRYLKECWENRQSGLLMAFRNSGKSTLVGLFCAWVLKQNPNMRVLIMAADYELAKKMVRNIKRVIEKHPLTKHLKPSQKDQWAADRFTVRRSLELRDPSVLARGLGANITGCRADLIICDDVEVPKTSETPAKREDLRLKLSELDFILVPTGFILYIGTPHAFDTIYSVDPGGFLFGFNVLKMPIFTKTGDSWWPERFSQSKIESIRKRSGPAKFASQMLLEPTNLTESRLNVKNLKWYKSDIDYIECNQTAELKINGKRMIGASCFWDPAFGKSQKADASVIACVFQDDEGFYYLHDIRYMIVEDTDESAKKQCCQVLDFAKENHLPAVYVETNGIGKFLPEILKRTFRENAFQCAVLPYTSHSAKAQRILDAFDVLLANGCLKVHEKIKKTDFYKEMEAWHPLSKDHDDGVDAVAGCLLNAPVRLPRRSYSLKVKPDWRFSKEEGI